MVFGSVIRALAYGLVMISSPQNNQENSGGLLSKLSTAEGGLPKCPPTWKPICASNSINYDSWCWLKWAQHLDPSIKFVHYGKCTSPPAPLSQSQSGHNHDLQAIEINNCTYVEVVDLLCGSDGKTYLNDEHFRCILQTENPDLKMAYRGKCKRKHASALAQDPILPLCGCPTIWNSPPVCGTDGNTYPNICAFDCIRQHMKSMDITLAYCGACKSTNLQSHERPSSSRGQAGKGLKCDCYMDYNPVCGSDNFTYKNLCHLDCARKENPSLQVTLCGQCQRPRQ